MAFTGTAVFAEVSKRVVRITGFSLAGDASGVFGLFGDSGAEVQLPDGFQPEDYADIDLAESVQVSVVPADQAVALAPAINVTKAAGPPFRVTVDNGNATASGALEIWMRFH